MSPHPTHLAHRIQTGAAVKRRPLEVLRAVVSQGAPIHNITADDTASACRGLGMRARNEASLRELIAQHTGKAEFASQVIVAAAMEQITRRYTAS